ncbi:MAG: YigZ family protein [Anaerovoracaceae bacterium]|nr:YigZ family protein [Bacillota bacterium]MDY2671304.1 YigZ family protein [Anaerovoracaceae bacterium]
MGYFVPARDVSAEQTIEKSKFIAYVSRVSSREEAEAFIAGIRDKHRDATHNVPAFVLGEKGTTRWASDDGEPQGTSGIPVLNVIEGRKLTDTVIVVTRYFGGIKLGTGGLMRAYTGVAREALDKAGVCEVTDMLSYTVNIGYAQFEKLKRSVKKNGFIEGEISYGEAVTFEIQSTEDQKEAVFSMLRDVTQGAVTPENTDVKKIKGIREI